MPLVGGGSGGTSVVSRAAVTLTNAQIKALPSTQVELVPAPGVNFAIAVMSMGCRLNTVAGAYTNVDANGQLIGAYGNWDNDATASLKTSGILDHAGWEAFWVVGGISLPNVAAYTSVLLAESGALSDVENAPIKLAASNAGDYTAGNAANTLKVTVFYATFDVS